MLGRCGALDSGIKNINLNATGCLNVCLLGNHHGNVKINNESPTIGNRLNS